MPVGPTSPTNPATSRGDRASAAARPAAARPADDAPAPDESTPAAVARLRAAQRAAVVACGLVVVTVLGAAVAGPFVPGQRPGADFELPTALLPPADEPTPLPTGEAVQDAVSPNGAPPWLVVLAFCVVLVVLAVVGRQAVRIVRRWLEQQRELAGAESFGPGEVLRGDVVDLAQPALAAGVDDAVEALARDLPPGDAVIAAWVALERSAERSGVVRDRAQTATEFTLELLDSTRADPAASRALLDLYLAARFSEHPVTDEHVTAARTALEQIGRGVRRRRTETAEGTQEETAEGTADEVADDEPSDDEAGTGAVDEPAGHATADGEGAS